MNAFVTGGFLPPAVRGTTHRGLVHICDWCELLLRRRRRSVGSWLTRLCPQMRRLRGWLACQRRTTSLAFLRRTASTSGPRS